MANRYGRRSRTRNWPDASSSSGTPTRAPGSSPDSGAEIIAWPSDSPTVAAEAAAFERIVGEIFEAEIPSAETMERQYWAQKNMEAMGFVFPRPGEAFGELGGLPAPADPLEERIRKELGL